MAKPGPKPISIDPDEVRKLAVLGATMEEMAAFFNCSKRTLQRRKFDTYIKRGTSERHISLRRAQYQAAMKGNTSMLIWLGKQDLGQTDKVEQTSQINLVYRAEFGNGGISEADQN